MAPPTPKLFETKIKKLEIPYKITSTRTETVLPPAPAPKPTPPEPTPAEPKIPFIRIARGPIPPVEPAKAKRFAKPIAPVKPVAPLKPPVVAPPVTPPAIEPIIPAVKPPAVEPITPPSAVEIPSGPSEDLLRKLAKLEEDVKAATAKSAFGTQAPAPVPTPILKPTPVVPPPPVIEPAPVIPPVPVVKPAPVVPAAPAIDPERIKAFDKAIFQRNPLKVQEMLKQEPKPNKEELKKMKEIAEDELNATEYKQDAVLEEIIYYLNQALKE